LANCFEANYGARPGATALLNIGAGVTNVVILEEGNVVFARDVIIGGQNYTMEIHKALGVSIPEAESLKISASLGQEVPNEVISIITNTTEQVVEEIRNAFEFYTATGGGNKPDLMFVSGGCIFIPNLVEELSKVLGVGFEVFNPFQSVTYDSKVLSAEYIQQIQSIAPVVLGLGMRGSKEK
jgi:type IV pilus assembly protein PilM